MISSTTAESQYYSIDNNRWICVYLQLMRCIRFSCSLHWYIYQKKKTCLFQIQEIIKIVKEKFMWCVHTSTSHRIKTNGKEERTIRLRTWREKKHAKKTTKDMVISSNDHKFTADFFFAHTFVLLDISKRRKKKKINCV